MNNCSETQKTPEILLASASPRRRQLLEHLHIPFVCATCDVDETMPQDCPPEDAVVRIAARKANAARELPESEGRIIIAADTIVVLEGEIFGKPGDEEAARAMLRRLSGKRHCVHTGVCIFTPGGSSFTFCDTTEVLFYPLSDRAIEDYIRTGEPMDKAGAYGIQGDGAMLVEAIYGSYHNVVGLPIARLGQVLQSIL